MRRAIALCLASFLATAASAQDGSPAAGDEPSETEEWQFSFSPYLWLLSMKGDVGVGDVTTNVDMDFSDIWDQLNFGLMGTGTARKGDLLFRIDGLGAILESNESMGPFSVGFGPTTAQQGPVNVNVPAVTTSVGPIDVDTKTTMVMVDLRGGWRVFNQPTSILAGRAEPEKGDERRFTIELTAGGRLWYLKADIDVSSPPIVIPGFSLQPTTPLPPLDLPDLQVPGTTLAGINLDVDQSTWWVDPVVGFRTNVDATDRLSFTVLGDVGGFDLGASSQNTWQAMGMVGWRVSRGWTLRLAYRALSLRREGKSGPDMDVLMFGPLLGATYEF
jgi:hypothetical protein